MSQPQNHLDPLICFTRAEAKNLLSWASTVVHEYSTLGDCGLEGDDLITRLEEFIGECDGN